MVTWETKLDSLVQGTCVCNCLEQYESNFNIYRRYKSVVGNVREGDRLEDPGVDGRIILKWVFEKWDGGKWIKSIWLRRGAGGGLL
jgi:hypothetical protein